MSTRVVNARESALRSAPILCRDYGRAQPDVNEPVYRSMNQRVCGTECKGTTARLRSITACVVALTIGVGVLSTPSCVLAQASAPEPDSILVFPGMLENEALLAGNPLATYAAIRDRESQYLLSPVFAGVYPEIRAAFEEFLGFPRAGVSAMSLPTLRADYTIEDQSPPDGFSPEPALDVIAREAAKTRLVIWGEEHHLPQTRSLYERMLLLLWDQGYRYLAAETFDESVMDSSFRYPDYKSGFYLRDPIFASAVRAALGRGYKLVAYETREQGPAGDPSFRDRTQAQTIKNRIFDMDPTAKVLIIAGRGHVAEEITADGWTPMASVLKQLTGINPLTLYAPTMSERLTRQEEHPMYRYVTSHGLLDVPTIFVSDTALLGTSSFDAYIFWPRTMLMHGRPDWLVREMGRNEVVIDLVLNSETLALIQAFRTGDPPTAIPVDQVVIESPDQVPALMVPTGRFWLRRIDRWSNVQVGEDIRVP